jgi:hypothetical protein
VVMGRVVEYLRQHPDQWSLSTMADGLGGLDGLFRCGQKALRAILARGVEEGRIEVSGEGRGKGTLRVPGSGKG